MASELQGMQERTRVEMEERISQNGRYDICQGRAAVRTTKFTKDCQLELDLSQVDTQGLAPDSRAE
jgi:hypothetical protein